MDYVYAIVESALDAFWTKGSFV